jgi:hypothetical protein
MPVQFRCYFCMQLLSIGRRRIGTVIQCPRCQGQVWVPDPAKPGTGRTAGSEVAGDIILTAVTGPTRRDPGTLWLTPRLIPLLLIALIVALVLSFGAGVWIGWAFRAV